jgi:hypothetical protein
VKNDPKAINWDDDEPETNTEDKKMLKAFKK